MRFTHSVFLVFVLVLLGGCGFIASGKDTNKLTVDHRCEVELDQLGQAKGADKTQLMESVEVKPDCTVTVTVTDTVSPTPLEELIGVDEKEQAESEATEAPADETQGVETAGTGTG